MQISKELYETLQNLTTSIHDDRGRELPNPVPMAIPAGIKRPPTLQEQIRRVLRTELSRQADEQGMETWEEANDFDVEGDDHPMSKYELMEEQEPLPIKNNTPAEPAGSGATPRTGESDGEASNQEQGEKED